MVDVRCQRMDLEGLLAVLLDCNSMDLCILDDVGYEFDKIVKDLQANNMGFRF